MSLGTGLCAKCDSPLNGSHHAYCKTCLATYQREHRAKNRDEYNAYQRDYQQAHREYTADWRYKSKLKNQYGLTIEDVQRLYAEQNGRCAICLREIFLRKKNSVDSAALDHDHVTGLVRKLLCGNCNKTLGLMGDDPTTLRSAAQYLESFYEREM